MKRKFFVATEYLSHVAAVLIIFTMLIGVADILTSKLFKWSIPDMVTFTAIAFSMTVAAPIAYIILARRHIEVELVEEKLPPPARFFLAIFSNTLGAAISAFICWRTFVGFLKSLHEGTSMGVIVSIPIWPGFLFLSLGFALAAVAFAMKAQERLGRPRNR